MIVLTRFLSRIREFFSYVCCRTVWVQVVTMTIFLIPALSWEQLACMSFRMRGHVNGCHSNITTCLLNSVEFTPRTSYLKF